MKIQILNYTFDKTAKTVTFTDYSSIRLDQILLITNVTTNTIIYDFSEPSLGGTVASNVLTLTYDTSAMSNTDKLQIFYQDEVFTANSSRAVTVFKNDSISNSLVQVKSTGGNVYGYTIYNSGSSLAWVKFYNKATSPVIGTDPVIYKIPILAGASVALAGSDILFGFSAGLYLNATLNIVDSDNNAPSANLFVQISYR